MMKPLFLMANSKKSADNNSNRDKLLALIEYCIITYLSVFLPSLLRLRHIPRNIDEIYLEIIAALIATLYGYRRYKGIEIPEQPEESS